MGAIRGILPVLALVLASTPFVSTDASHFSNLEGSPDLRSASALISGEDGEVIYAKDIDTVRPVASITKLVTAMVVTAIEHSGALR